MGQSLSLAERVDVIAAVARLGVKALVIIGAGEPSTPYNFRQFVRPIIEAAYTHGLTTVMFTTAIGIDRVQAEFYRDHDVTIVVSLDSLNPETYRTLTGGVGNLSRILNNIAVLREVYRGSIRQQRNGNTLVRLGINVTIQRPNQGELGQIRAFTGDDMLFVCNIPMPAGRFAVYTSWEETVGDENLEHFAELAREQSDTGSHSSVVSGACGYFSRGIAVDIDGQLLSCAYASASAESLANVRDLSDTDLLAHYHRVRSAFSAWQQRIARRSSCPLRDPDFQGFLDALHQGMENPDTTPPPP